MSQQTFKRDRYCTQALLKAYENAKPVNKNDELTLALSLEDSFEIYGSQTVSKALLLEIISQIPAFDAMVQAFCEKACKSGKFGRENYAVSLSWITLEAASKVELGYWGEYVNIELRAIFVKNKDKWEKEDIYYQ